MSSPFEDNHASPWNRRFVDLPELNAKASDGVADAIARVQGSARGERRDLASASLLVLGPAGAGKTHLFMRLRRKLGPRAVFVHLRPLLGAEMTPRYVLGELVRQLDYESAAPGRTFRQLDTLVGAAFAYLRLEPIHLPGVQLDQLRALDGAGRRHAIDWAIEQIAQRHPEVDDLYALRLLEAPFLTTTAARRASLAWLSGRELDPAQLERLGAGAGLAEERVVPALQTLALFATPGAPIVLVFDQLENLIDPAGTGERVRAYGNLVAELFDTMRGVVIVQMALDTEWSRAILPQLSQTQKTRLDAERQILALPTGAERRELVRLWLSELPEPAGAFPAPFDEARLAAWCEAAGMTPRMLMIECQRALALPEELRASPPTGSGSTRPPADDAAELEGTWEAHLGRARLALDEASGERRPIDGARVRGGIAGALRLLGADDLRIEAPSRVRFKHAGRAWAVSWIDQVHPRAVGAALDRAGEDLAAGQALAAREQALEFPPTWRQTRARLAAFQAAGGRWLSLPREEIARLLALESFLSAARSGDVEGQLGRALAETEVVAWIARALPLGEWAIARALGPAAPEELVADRPTETPPEPEARAEPPRSVVEACMTQLRLASLERLVREVTRARPGSTRAEVLAGLAGMGDRVEWFGASSRAQHPGTIVALRGAPR